MKIAIDARFFGPQGKGLGRYTQKLVEELEKIDTVNQYDILVNPDTGENYTPANPNFRKVVVDIPWYTVKEQREMPKVLNQGNYDLVHFLHFNVPVLYTKPYIVTIHDLILLEYPTRKASTKGWLIYQLKSLAYKQVIVRAIKASQKIIAISQFTEDSIKKFFHVPDEKFAMIYEGVDREKFQEEHKKPFNFEKFGIEKGRYLLYVGNVYPHKNIPFLLDAFKQWKRVSTHPDAVAMKLVLVGKEDYFYKRTKEEVKERDLQNDVVFTEFVPDEELLDLYQNCASYVFPSLYEGFGLPPMEALSMGAKVYLAHATCLPEIFGDIADYFDPKSLESFVSGLDAHLEKSPPSSKSVEKFLSQYSWEKMAEETLNVYNEVK